MVADFEKFKRYKNTRTIIIFNTVEEFRLFNPEMRVGLPVRFEEEKFIAYIKEDSTGVGISFESCSESWCNLEYFLKRKHCGYSNHNFINIKEFIIDSIIEVW